MRKNAQKMAFGSSFGALGCVLDGPEPARGAPRAVEDGPKNWGSLGRGRFVTLLGALRRSCAFFFAIYRVILRICTKFCDFGS